MIVNKYLYISKSKQYGKVGTRLSSTKIAAHKDEICIKLNIDIDTAVFEDLLPTVTLEIPKTYRRTINLRIAPE
jgi:hypothetical protein